MISSDAKKQTVYSCSTQIIHLTLFVYNWAMNECTDSALKVYVLDKNTVGPYLIELHGGKGIELHGSRKQYHIKKKTRWSLKHKLFP